ncbi:PRRT4 isoform 7, partial [Pan troglodytes]
SKPRASSLLPESTSRRSGPSDGPTDPYQPRRSTVTWDTALMVTALPSSAPRPHQSELELKFDMALRAGAAPTLGHRTLPLLPSLRASLAEIAGRLGPFGFFGTTLSPLRNFSGLSPPGETTSTSSASGVSGSLGFLGTTLSLPPYSLERKLSSPILACRRAAGPSSSACPRATRLRCCREAGSLGPQTRSPWGAPSLAGTRSCCSCARWQGQAQTSYSRAEVAGASKARRPTRPRPRLPLPAAITPWTSARPPQSTCDAASRRPSAARPCLRLASSRALPSRTLCLGSDSTAPPRWGPGAGPVRDQGRPLAPLRPRSSPPLGLGPQAAASHLARSADSRGTARPCCCVPAPTGPRAALWSASSVPRGPQEAAPASRPQDPTRPCPHPLATPQSLLLSCRPRRPCCRSSSWTPADRSTS